MTMPIRGFSRVPCGVAGTEHITGAAAAGTGPAAAGRVKANPARRWEKFGRCTGRGGWLKQGGSETKPMPKLTVEGVGTFDVPPGKRLVNALEDEARVDQLHA